MLLPEVMLGVALVVLATIPVTTGLAASEVETGRNIVAIPVVVIVAAALALVVVIAAGVVVVAATRLVVVVVVTEAGGMGLVLVIVTAVVDTVGVDIAAVESQPLHVLSHLSPTTSHKPCVKIR